MIRFLQKLLPAALLLAAGCVHFQYEGENLAPTAEAALYTAADRVPKPYEVIGRAVVYGAYQDVSRLRLEERLTAEAEAHGADAVLITSIRVIPEGDAVTVAPIVNSMEAAGAENTYSLNQLQRDFDGGYGQAFDNRPVTPTVREYRRQIHAEFLKFKPDAPKP